MNKRILFASIATMAMQNGFNSTSNRVVSVIDDGKYRFNGKNSKPKNKLNLSDDQIELIKTMSPKQKRKYLKSLEI